MFLRIADTVASMEWTGWDADDISTFVRTKYTPVQLSLKPGKVKEQKIREKD